MKNMSEVKADVDLVRLQMEAMGYELAARLIPVVHIAGTRWASVNGGQIVLMRQDREWDEAIYRHELCHTQQVSRGTTPDYREDGQVNHVKWSTSPRELQAMAIQQLTGVKHWRALAKACRTMPLAEHWRFIEMAKKTSCSAQP